MPDILTATSSSFYHTFQINAAYDIFFPISFHFNKYNHHLIQFDPLNLVVDKSMLSNLHRNDRHVSNIAHTTSPWLTAQHIFHGAHVG
jgi:hypothetical protein